MAEAVVRQVVVADRLEDLARGGTQIPRQARPDVTSRTRACSPSWCRRIHARSRLPEAVPVTRRNRSSPSRATVRSDSIRLGRSASACTHDAADPHVHVVRAEALQEAEGAGTETSNFAKLVSSNSAARSRTARCSATIAVDHCSPAQPRGRRSSWAPSSFDRNQFARSQPAFSPNSASSFSVRTSGPSGAADPPRSPRPGTGRRSASRRSRRPSPARSRGSGTGARIVGCPSSTDPSRARPRRSTPPSTVRSRPPVTRARRSPPPRRIPPPRSRRG